MQLRRPIAGRTQRQGATDLGLHRDAVLFTASIFGVRVRVPWAAGDRILELRAAGFMVRGSTVKK